MEILEQAVSTISPNDTSLFSQPVMHFFSSAFLWGSVAFQLVLGRVAVKNPRSSLLKRDVDSFIETESPIALEQLLCNIGADGCHSSGVDSGVVIASPSTENPDCKSPTITYTAPEADRW